MEPTQLDAIGAVIKSLGFDPVQVGQWTTLLVAWRFAIKLISGQIQTGLESAIAKAQSAGDSQIVGWLCSLIHSLPYRLLAWTIDTVLSVKLPLDIPKTNQGTDKGKDAS